MFKSIVPKMTGLSLSVVSSCKRVEKAAETWYTENLENMGHLLNTKILAQNFHHTEFTHSTVHCIDLKHFIFSHDMDDVM